LKFHNFITYVLKISLFGIICGSFQFVSQPPVVLPAFFSVGYILLVDTYYTHVLYIICFWYRPDNGPLLYNNMYWYCNRISYKHIFWILEYTQICQYLACCMFICSNLWNDIFNCYWVATRWQLFSTHVHTNKTGNVTKQTIHRTTQQLGRMRAVPRLCEFYPGICLTTEEKAQKNLSQGSHT